VIYAGFVATNGLAPSSERKAQGDIVLNKLSYTTTQQHPTNPRSYYIPYNKKSKKDFSDFHFIFGCVCLAIIKLCQVWLDVWIKTLKELI